jgi:hypothetical protein
LKEALNLAGHVAFTRSNGANEPMDARARGHLGDSGKRASLKFVLKITASVGRLMLRLLHLRLCPRLFPV